MSVVAENQILKKVVFYSKHPVKMKAKLTHKTRVETILRWKTSNNRICDALRDNGQAYAQARHKILQEKRFFIARQPLGDRKSSFQSFSAARFGDFPGHDRG